MKEYLAINAHRGLYRYNRLPMGVSFSPTLFQHNIDHIIQGLNGVHGYLIDVIISGHTREEHKNLLALLNRFHERGI